jgi:hypothetical protein
MSRPQAKETKSFPRNAAAALGLFALTLLAYSNSFSTGFALDNNWLLLQDKRIQDAASENIRMILEHTYWWPYGESYLYRPLTTLSYLFNYAILGNGANSTGYHWINFFLHAGNVLLVYLLALRLIRRFWPAVMLAALWAVHPVLTESVTNMVGRSDLLAGAAVLGGFWMYLKSAESTGARQWAWLAGLAVVTVIGVFSKESAAVIVGVIVLYELTWWRERRRTRSLLLGCLATLPALEAMWYQRSAVLANLGPAQFPFYDNPLTGADFWTTRLTAIKVMARYLSLLIWPASLSCDYSYAQIPFATGTAADWAAWLFVAVVAGTVLLCYRYNRTAFFFGAFAFLTFLPTANLLFPIGAVMAERFLYLPSLGILACAVLAAFWIADNFDAERAAIAALSIIVGLLAIRTWVRNSDWRDDLTLAAAAVEISPHSFKGHEILAGALFASDPAHANLDRVVSEADQAVAILDPLPDLRNNPRTYRAAGNYHLARGDIQKSLRLLLRSAAITKVQRDSELARQRDRGIATPAVEQAEYADLQRLISTVWLRTGDLPKAFEAAISALSLSPLNPENYRQAARVLVADGNSHEAAVALMQGVLVTTDQTLRAELLQLYRGGLDPAGCSTISTPKGPSLNPSCPPVHEDLCAASLKTVRLRLQMRRSDYARDMKTIALRDFGCPAAPFQEALPE